MKKQLIGAGLASLLAFSLLGTPATAAAKKQVVEGTILLPAPYTDDSGCFAGLHRRGAILTAENNNGAIGWHFDVDPKTVGKKFTLAAEGQGYVDVDILFYQKFGTPEDVVGDPLAAGAPASMGYQTREEGGEKGKVPPGMPKAIICMYGGGAGVGLLGNFTYTAG